MRNSRAQEQRLAEVTRRRLEALAPAVPEAPVQRRPHPQRAGRHARRPVSTGSRVGGWVADRLPATLQGRVHLGAAQLGLVALVVALGLLGTAWWMVRAAGQEGTVAPPRPVALATDEASAPAAATGSGTTTAEADIVVDVAGRVRRPGIAVLPAGSRVVDALEAAGGVRRGVDLSVLNLARVLVDGEQVLVGDRAPAAGAVSAPPGAGPGSLVSINTADQAALEELPGVGPVTASAIVAWREEHGGFSAVEELLEVSGIGPATLAELLPHVTL